MRLATDADSEFFLFLRNDPRTRRYSHHSQIITPEGHAEWWATTQDLRFIEDKVGVVRVSREGRVSIILAPEVRGQGKARDLLEEVLNHLDEKTVDPWNPKRKYTAEVHQWNVGSLIVFLKAGFLPYAMDGMFLLLRRS